MANEMLQFMDKQNASALASALLAKANIRIGERIVKEISETSTDKQLPSARLLQKLVTAKQEADTTLTGRVDTQDATFTKQGSDIGTLKTSQEEQTEKLTTAETKLGTIDNLVKSLAHFTIQTVTGAIETITEPSNRVFYFQRDNEEDKTWMLYIHVDDIGWINIGDTEIDLSNIWSKNDTEAMKEALGMHDVKGISDDRISTIIDEQFTATEIDFGTYTLIEKPTLAKATLTSTGQTQTPVFSGYNATQMTMSGNTAEKMVGSYTTIFTPKKGFKWTDNTTDEVSIEWNIDYMETNLNSVDLLTDIGFTGTEEDFTIPETFTLSKYNIECKVTRISGVFSKSASLKSLNIPKTVSDMNLMNPAALCSNLTSINVDPDNPNYCSVDGVLFNKDKTVLYGYPAGKTETTYTISDRVGELASNAFGGCTRLTDVVIPEGVTSLEIGLFNGCTSLTTITIPKTVTIIDRKALFNCSSLTTVNFTGTEEEWNNITILDDDEGEQYNTTTVLNNATKVYNYVTPTV